MNTTTPAPGRTSLHKPAKHTYASWVQRGRQCIAMAVCERRPYANENKQQRTWRQVYNSLQWVPLVKQSAQTRGHVWGRASLPIGGRCSRGGVGPRAGQAGNAPLEYCYCSSEQAVLTDRAPMPTKRLNVSPSSILATGEQTKPSIWRKIQIQM